MTSLTDVGSLRRTMQVDADVRGLDADGPTALRVLLVADVLRRVTEDIVGGQGDLHVLVGQEGTGTRALAARARAMWIREPSEWSADGHDPAGRTVTVAAGDRTGPLRLLVGAVAEDPRHRFAEVCAQHDPLTVRLALLRFAPDAAATLSEARLRRAEETLRRWRYKVADWSHLASAPPVDATTVDRGLTTRLDTAFALAFLHRVEIDHDVPSGGKFETFSRLDRVLALDLGHDIGRVPYYDR